MADLTPDQYARLLAVARDAIREGWAEDEYDPIYSTARKLGVRLSPGQAARIMAQAQKTTARP